MKNPYKRTDVYSCNYNAHAKFRHRVSVYHVEQVKKCHPQGCVIFHWSCVRFNKGKSCPRKYKYVGRLCRGCSFFEDEKINYQPEVKLSQIEYEYFRQQREEFDEWLSENLLREQEISVKVVSIKPCFRKRIFGKKGQIRLEGYLLTFKQGFIGTINFDDYFYAQISPNQQERHRFACGDKFEARGKFLFDRGRILFPKLWAIAFEQKSGRDTWTNSQALVARQTASYFESQNENCLRCRWGALVDVTENIHGIDKHKRELYCMQSISDPALCSIHAKRQIDNCI